MCKVLRSETQYDRWAIYHLSWPPLKHCQSSTLWMLIGKTRIWWNYKNGLMFYEVNSIAFCSSIFEMKIRIFHFQRKIWENLKFFSEIYCVKKFQLRSLWSLMALYFGHLCDRRFSALENFENQKNPLKRFQKKKNWIMPYLIEWMNPKLLLCNDSRVECYGLS